MEDEVSQQQWYKRPKWLAALASFIAACSFAAFVTTTIFTSAEAEKTGSNVEDLEGAIRAIEENQKGIDELVTFVRDLQQQRPPSSAGNTERLFGEAMELLCASSDPVRLEACQRLRQAEQ